MTGEEAHYELNLQRETTVEDATGEGVKVGINPDFITIERLKMRGKGGIC